MRTLSEGVDLCRAMEPVLIGLGYHCALAGSVLIKGLSKKDIDVLVYPHDPEKPARAVEEIMQALAPLGFTVWRECDERYVNRNVWITMHNNRRVDLFFI